MAGTAWALAQRFIVAEPVAEECAAKLRGTEPELTTGLAALAWAAPELAQRGDDLGTLAGAIADQLRAGGRRAALAA
jgi:hypothetical protein